VHTGSNSISCVLLGGGKVSPTRNPLVTRTFVLHPLPHPHSHSCLPSVALHSEGEMGAWMDAVKQSIISQTSGAGGLAASGDAQRTIGVQVSQARNVCACMLCMRWCTRVSVKVCCFGCVSNSVSCLGLWFVECDWKGLFRQGSLICVWCWSEFAYLLLVVSTIVSVENSSSFPLQVLQVRKKDTGKIYAMKVLNKKNILENGELEHTRTEKNILQKLVCSCSLSLHNGWCFSTIVVHFTLCLQAHPFLVNLNYSFQTHDKLYFVMDYINGGTLHPPHSFPTHYNCLRHHIRA
jgi:hypothetical protein